MGMFDDITFAREMPGDPKPRHGNFQTKDLECALDRYHVDEHGIIRRREWEPDARVWIDCDPLAYHGMLRFYTCEDIEGTGVVGRRSHHWFEYEAKFTDGKLEGVEVIDIHKWGVDTEQRTQLALRRGHERG
jgi:hypothetical protein